MPKSQFTDAYDTFCEVIALARKRKGITQVELAKMLGKPQSWVSAYENGLRRLDVVEFIAIARALDVDPQRLFRAVVSEMPNKLEI